MPVPSEEELLQAQHSWQSVSNPEAAAFMQGKRVFLSINRFERKKVATGGICIDTTRKTVSCKQWQHRPEKVEDWYT